MKHLTACVFSVYCTWHLKHIKRTIYYYRVGFILGSEGWCKIHKSLDHITKLRGRIDDHVNRCRKGIWWNSVSSFIKAHNIPEIEWVSWALRKPPVISPLLTVYSTWEHWRLCLQDLEQDKDAHSCHSSSVADIRKKRKLSMLKEVALSLRVDIIFLHIEKYYSFHTHTQAP